MVQPVLQYKIFYQSLEYPNRYTTDIVEQFGKLTVNKDINLTNGNVPAKLKACLEENTYHSNVHSLVSTLFEDTKADILIIGEYCDPRYDARNSTWNHSQEGYKIVGVVGKTTRGMTVYCKTNQELEGCRISTLDGTIVNTHYIDTRYESIRDTQFYTDREGTQTRLQKLSEVAKGAIGQCIEVMIYNRYMLFAHIKGEGSKARDNLMKTLSPDYIKKIDGSNDTITYVVAGDLNAKESYKNTHIVAKFYQENIRMHLSNNTNALSMNGDYIARSSKEEIQQIQQILNIPGKTSSGEVCHDGIYIPHKEMTREEYIIEGSWWPIVNFGDKKYALLGDHKGFLLRVEITHSRESSPTMPFTAPNSRAPSPISQLNDTADINIDDTTDTISSDVKPYIIEGDRVVLKFEIEPYMIECDSVILKLVGREVVEPYMLEGYCSNSISIYADIEDRESAEFMKLFGEGAI